VPLPWGFTAVEPLPFAAGRMDTWVLKVSIAVPLLAIAALALWHLLAYLAGKLPAKPRTARQSPEPPEASGGLPPADLARNEGIATELSPLAVRDDPERLQQACLALEGSLATRYVELAESWLRRGQTQKAAAAFRRVLHICPDTAQARLAQDRLQQIGKEA
jgi:hypothetical protein